VIASITATLGSGILDPWGDVLGELPTKITIPVILIFYYIFLYLLMIAYITMRNSAKVLREGWISTKGEEVWTLGNQEKSIREVSDIIEKNERYIGKLSRFVITTLDGLTAIILVVIVLLSLNDNGYLPDYWYAFVIVFSFVLIPVIAVLYHYLVAEHIREQRRKS